MYPTDKKHLTSNHTLIRKEGEGPIDSWDVVFLKMTEPGDSYFLLQKVLMSENPSEKEKKKAV